MKSIERYDLLMKALSEGKSMSEAAREQNVTCALLSQVKKKHTPKEELSSLAMAITHQPKSETAEA